MARDSLVKAAELVDIIAVARAIIGQPERQSVDAPPATVLALACGINQFWSIVLDARDLLQALDLPADHPCRAAAIEQQSASLRQLLGELRLTEPQAPNPGDAA